MSRNHARAAALYKVGFPAATLNEELPQLTLVDWYRRLLGGFEESKSYGEWFSFDYLHALGISNFSRAVETFGRIVTNFYDLSRL